LVPGGGFRYGRGPLGRPPCVPMPSRSPVRGGTMTGRPVASNPEPRPPMTDRPLLLITMGDVAGIGPEIIARAWPALLPLARPVVVGDPGWMRRALELTGTPADVRPVPHPAACEPDAAVVPCLPGSGEDLSGVQPGVVCAAAGKAAYDFLCTAIDRTLAGEA